MTENIIKNLREYLMTVELNHPYQYGDSQIIKTAAMRFNVKREEVEKIHEDLVVSHRKKTEDRIKELRNTGITDEEIKRVICDELGYTYKASDAIVFRSKADALDKVACGTYTESKEISRADEIEIKKAIKALRQNAPEVYLLKQFMEDMSCFRDDNFFFCKFNEVSRYERLHLYVAGIYDAMSYLPQNYLLKELLDNTNTRLKDIHICNRTVDIYLDALEEEFRKIYSRFF